MNKYPRESEEPVVFGPVLVNGVEVQDFQYSLTQGLDRPVEWLDPISVGADKGFMLSGDMEWGYWQVWTKVGEVIIQGERFLLT